MRQVRQVRQAAWARANGLAVHVVCYPDIGCSIERALVAATSSLEELSAVSVSSNTRSTSLFQETEVLDAADSLRDSLMRRAEL